MNGYQLTFYTEKNRKHGHQTVCEWLLHKTRELGICGATVINCAEGVGHAGARHAAHVLKLTDQPLQIILAVTAEEAEQLLEIVRTERLHVFYVRYPVEFGVIAGDLPNHAEPAHAPPQPPSTQG
jgi:PII-like signaling protein